MRAMCGERHATTGFLWRDDEIRQRSWNSVQRESKREIFRFRPGGRENNVAVRRSIGAADADAQCLEPVCGVGSILEGAPCVERGFEAYRRGRRRCGGGEEDFVDSGLRRDPVAIAARYAIDRDTLIAARGEKKTELGGVGGVSGRALRRKERSVTPDRSELPCQAAPTFARADVVRATQDLSAIRI
ncbi:MULTISPECIES: hypothetical protein [Methylosinus]|uniref:hypothetical protein n=1 Tax=Methylosinus TaxID=425 RepID=UPI0012DCC4B5|nr:MULTISPECIES: hypothetical protein [Methylosinus]